MIKYLSILLRLCGALVALLTLTYSMSSCTATLLTGNYIGKNIRPGFQIPIQPGGLHSAIYKTDDLSVHYQYARSGDTMKMTGSLTFGSGIQFNFNYIDYFNLGLLIGDPQGRIVAKNPLVSTSWVNLTLPNRQVRFSKNFTIPPDAAVMVFYYTGQASEGGRGGGENGGGNIQFWQFPVVK